MPINLAPNHKQGLVVNNPILLGAGTIGYGEVVPKGLDLAQMGGAVVGPIQGGSRGGAPPPRLAHLNGGVVLATGLQNRGLNSAVQRYAKLWPKLGCPIIAQLADSHPPGAGQGRHEAERGCRPQRVGIAAARAGGRVDGGQPGAHGGALCAICRCG